MKENINKDINRIIHAIERMQMDHEASLKTDEIDIRQTDDYFMINNKLATSVFSTKVVYAHSTDTLSADAIFEQAQNFFKDKAYSWWTTDTRDSDIAEKLIKNGWTVLDHYEGRYKTVCDAAYVNEICDIKVLENHDTKAIHDLAVVTSTIWGTLNEDNLSLSVRRYTEYLNAPDRRGGYLLAYVGERAVGYGNYRLSSCGSFLYLSGTGVLPEFRKKGIYTQLLNKRMAMAGSLGASYLLTQARIGHSSPILEKLDFKLAGEYTVYLKK